MIRVEKVDCAKFRECQDVLAGFFLGHETAREILIKDGKPRLIRERKDITEFN